MKPQIAKQLRKIAAITLRAEELYLQGKPGAALEELDKLEDFMENVIEDLGNEDSEDFDWDSVKKHPKYGNLPTKKVENI